ncbi:hypothetical protein HN832_04900 [archaeon]|jgi:hypothetical protein|nr:hypothetical protein [archaeon]MBT4374026.1 hypothetical protein [archaeon]MBT4532122.1 hypothetical protein [archaeon]MBT7002012.1 hypothetical protein [archaeon]MBT7282723.1 hypothetical protein [archaeon]
MDSKEKSERLRRCLENFKMDPLKCAEARDIGRAYARGMYNRGVYCSLNRRRYGVA